MPKTEGREYNIDGIDSAEGLFGQVRLTIFAHAITGNLEFTVTDMADQQVLLIAKLDESQAARMLNSLVSVIEGRAS